jgi:integrase
LLEWTDVHLKPAANARFGFIRIRRGKSGNAKRTLSLTERVAGMLRDRKLASTSQFVFPGETDEAPILGTSLDHQHERVRELLGLGGEFVLHSLRHTFLTRLGESGADAFTIMRIAGHSSVTVSQKYVHPSPEALERAFERLDTLNKLNREAAVSSEEVPTDPPTAVVEITSRKRRKPFA